MANKDALTGLDDRNAFYLELTERIEKANRFNTRLALLIADIDHFHRINDERGYTVGDRLLGKFGELIQSVARGQDYVARIGDNTFALVLEGVMNQGHAELAARKIHRLLEVPFTMGGQLIQVRCTTSISLCPVHAKDARHLLKAGETALRDARINGNSIGFAYVEPEDEISEFWDIEMALSQALHNDEFRVFYQPKVSLTESRVTGAEALLRWKHPQRGFIPADTFIPLAEKTGLIKPVTNWLLNKVLRQSDEWTDKWGGQQVSVNIPPEFILMPDMKDLLSNAINLWAGDVSLTLEIIERSLVTQVDLVIQVLNELREMGIKISIDDFGTGYSSLSYFEKLPVDELKIDQSFVTNLLQQGSSRKIVKLVIDLAKAFDLKVVAEGVEDFSTVRYLNKIDCDVIQGFYFSKPLPHEQYMTWLQEFEMPVIEGE